ncbi:hypothetical protein L596_005753 [Steinernema carpocapsae]|uniref:Uncharacterized protein n=1 Tax=Steinernema carpocapsae TaxID=34508 RepID=A0A4U8V006_STECR|nr:hypothetical protein L596_005753 [Steinernema carpocapsae]
MGKTALHDTFNAVQFNPLFSGQFVFGTTTPSNYKTAEHYLKLTWCPSGINKQDIEIIMWICCYEYKKI